MTVSARALLHDVIEALPPEPDERQIGDPADDLAYAALVVLTEPSAAEAALAELAVLDRIEAAKPHLVRVKKGIVETPDRDEKGRQITLAGVPQFTRTNTVTACPDCTRGLYSIDGVLVCIQLPDRVGTFDGKPGDVVACGRER